MTNSSETEKKTAIIGAGAWGTTLSWLLGHQGNPVVLWARDAGLAEQMQATRENAKYLPGVVFPDSVTVTSDLGAALSGVDTVVIAVPSHGFRDVVVRAAEHIAAGSLIVSVVKGLERGSGMRMSEILAEELGPPHAHGLAVLSGPNLSREITQGMPAVSVAASPDPTVARRVQALFNSKRFRVYRNYDIIGVEVCGALKNVIAIGSGISDGLGFGDNAKAALITRGLAEIGRLGVQLGAQPATFWGIAGVGDLITTCHSRLSRNRQVGCRLARGESLSAIQDNTPAIAEGVFTAAAARELGMRLGIELPVTEAVYQILFEGAGAPAQVEQLMSRPEKMETEPWQIVNGQAE